MFGIHNNPDLMYWLGALFGYIGGRFYPTIKERIEVMLKKLTVWKCPDCEFVVKTTNPAIIETVQETHKHS